jgi:hypothetical protein
LINFDCFWGKNHQLFNIIKLKKKERKKKKKPLLLTLFLIREIKSQHKILPTPNIFNENLPGKVLNQVMWVQP